MQKKTINVKYNVANPTNSGVTFKSNNIKIATVTSKGVVTAKGFGLCYITVTTKAKVKGKKLTKKVPIYVNGGKYGFINGYKYQKVLNTANNIRKNNGYSALVWSNNSNEWKRIVSWADRMYNWDSIQFSTMAQDRKVTDDSWVTSNEHLFKAIQSIGIGNTYDRAQKPCSQKKRDDYIDKEIIPYIKQDSICKNENIEYITAWMCVGKYQTYYDLRVF